MRLRATENANFRKNRGKHCFLCSLNSVNNSFEKKWFLKTHLQFTGFAGYFLFFGTSVSSASKARVHRSHSARFALDYSVLPGEGCPWLSLREGVNLRLVRGLRLNTTLTLCLTSGNCLMSIFSPLRQPASCLRRWLEVQKNTFQMVFKCCMVKAFSFIL